MPAVLPWLDRSRLVFIRPLGGDVTSVELLASAAFWLGLWLAAWVVLGQARRANDAVEVGRAPG